ncbi:transposase [Streptomyces yerevanensis]|uniref:transposase n=1 Tax=Streptomyces yerevanensis TaxID=66378 RepID=UPI00068ADE94|nr:transposase [Streptomyces yerevanensis]
MCHPDRLSESEGKQLTDILARCPKLAAADRLVRNFGKILSTRTGQHLKDWGTVVQGLTTHWNSGPVEGRVDHIKMVKGQMFGRAKLPLLRKRVLLTAVR